MGRHLSQQLRHTWDTHVHSIIFGSNPRSFASISASCSHAHMMTQILGSLQTTEVNWIQFQAPSFSLAQTSFYKHMVNEPVNEKFCLGLGGGGIGLMYICASAFHQQRIVKPPVWVLHPLGPSEPFSTSKHGGFFFLIQNSPSHFFI